MRPSVGHVVAVVLLALAGGVCWLLGGVEQHIAAAHEQVATMHYVQAAEDPTVDAPLGYLERLPGVGSRIRRDARLVRATAEYWLGKYDALKAPRDAGGAPAEQDPDLLLLAANASFRVAQAEAADRTAMVSRLNDVIKNYADVLKSRPGDVNAAYNYEFAVRKRDEAARQRGALPKPEDHTIHGQPGAPPQGESMSQFKLMVPKRNDERQENPEAGKGGAKPRKG